MDKAEIVETLRLNVMLVRKEAGLTQRECAARMGISESSWGLAESGNTQVSIDRLLQMLLTIDRTAGAEAMRLIGWY